MNQCLYCNGKLETIKKGFNIGQQVCTCTNCKAIFIKGKNKKDDYECDENDNPQK